MTTLTLPFPPSVNALFINRRGGRARTKAYNAWIERAGWSLVMQRARPVTGPVGLHYEVEEGHRFDLGNVEKPLTDALVKFRIIEGDGPKIVRAIGLSWSTAVEGVRVVITPQGVA